MGGVCALPLLCLLGLQLVLRGPSSIAFLPGPWTANRSSLRKLPLVVAARSATPFKG